MRDNQVHECCLCGDPIGPGAYWEWWSGLPDELQRRVCGDCVRFACHEALAVLLRFAAREFRLDGDPPDESTIVQEAGGGK